VGDWVRFGVSEVGGLGREGKYICSVG
jgi:hypothetical protein